MSWTTPAVIEVDKLTPQPWRNGGGQTRELLAWPSAADWQLRISVADITAAGPFSPFPGVQRWFAVVEGGGVRLNFADDLITLRPGDAPIQFDGAAAPGCEPVEGATRDLNLMLRGGRGTMQSAFAGQTWCEPFAQRGLLTAVDGCWHGSRQSAALPRLALLWLADTAGEPFRFEPDTAPPAGAPIGWWLGFTPDGDSPR